MVLPVFVVVVLFFALLISYPWVILSLGTISYLVCLPLGWWSYRRYQRRDEAAAVSARTAAHDAPHVHGSAGLSDGGDRPMRLN
jgi:CDP-diacylglycerol--serine O-phosphatidyltransferase